MNGVCEDGVSCCYVFVVIHCWEISAFVKLEANWSACELLSLSQRRLVQLSRFDTLSSCNGVLLYGMVLYSTSMVLVAVMLTAFMKPVMREYFEGLSSAS